MSWPEFERLVNEAVDPLVSELTNFLKEEEASNRKYDYLVLSGDFSSSGYIQLAIREAFGASSPFGLNIISPKQHPSLVVIHGAVLSGGSSQCIRKPHSPEEKENDEEEVKHQYSLGGGNESNKYGTFFPDQHISSLIVFVKKEGGSKRDALLF